MIVMCGVQLKGGNRYSYLMFMLSLIETMDQLAIADSVHWYCHVLREDGHVLMRALDFVVEGQRMNGKPKRTWKSRFRKVSRFVLW